MTKKIRFEVFKRDGFKCAYCGKAPPDVLLEIDHINPKSKGGEDDINNLLTSCFDCNRGKKAIPLDIIPSKLVENLEILKEKELQLIEYNEAIAKIENRINEDIDDIEQIFHDGFHTAHCFSDSFRRSIKRFLKSLPKNEVLEAMQMTVDRCKHGSNEDIENSLKYFCGICWHKIKGVMKNGKTNTNT